MLRSTTVTLGLGFAWPWLGSARLGSAIGLGHTCFGRREYRLDRGRGRDRGGAPGPDATKAMLSLTSSPLSFSAPVAASSSTNPFEGKTFYVNPRCAPAPSRAARSRLVPHL